MDAVVAELAKDYCGGNAPSAASPSPSSAVPFFRVEADAAATAAAAERLGVSAVPTTVFVKSGKVSAKVEGPDPPALADAVAAQLGPPPPPKDAGRKDASGKAEAASSAAAAAVASPSGVPLDPIDPSTGSLTPAAREALERLVKRKPVMLFMKGDPQQPRCGFSRRVAEALQDAGVAKAPKDGNGGGGNDDGDGEDFGTFDILRDEGVRSGLKVLSDWPTFPQLYVSGELVGGCDIIMEMAEAGTLKKTVDEMRSVL